MLQNVDVGERSIEAYRGIAPREILEELHSAAQSLRGIRVLHLNATPYGGGVAELLRSVVPLLNNLGIVADWKIIGGSNEFFQVTKTIHNALQGSEHELDKEDQQLYLKVSEQNARYLEEAYDIVFIHDPQPAPIPFLRGKAGASWVWRCHIDTSSPNPYVWDFLRKWLDVYDAAIFTMDQFIPPGFPIKHVEIIPPAIDPLSPKNLPLPDDIARRVLSWIGVRLNVPLITQVARFDLWKDPMGVIEAYRLARREISTLQLALVGSMALDDPEGWDIYKKILIESEQDPLIHVFTNLTGVGNIEVNAFQTLSEVIVQKSVREGFGLVVSEALWKGTPVVAGEAGGIPLQMADGAGGYLVGNVEECAEAVIRLLKEPDRAADIAQAGKERVRKHFLLPRLLLNELSLIQRLVAGQPPARQMREIWLDPVCGMSVEKEPSLISADFEGHKYAFCSKACLSRFLSDPKRYTAKQM